MASQALSLRAAGRLRSFGIVAPIIVACAEVSMPPGRPKRWHPFHMTSEGLEHVRLDLSGYRSRDLALDLAAHGCPAQYTAIAKKYMSSTTQVTDGFLLFGSVVSRMRGLHEGVVREIAADNPHAVHPLTRAWVEIITITMYVLRNPRYGEFLLRGYGDGRPGKKSFEAMFHAVREDASQLKLVYGELSEFSHFGPLGVWNVHAIEDKEQRIMTWTDVPRWRNDDHFRVACAQAHELAVAGLHFLDELGQLLIHEGRGGADD